MALGGVSAVQHRRRLQEVRRAYQRACGLLLALPRIWCVRPEGSSVALGRKPLALVALAAVRPRLAGLALAAPTLWPAAGGGSDRGVLSEDPRPAPQQPLHLLGSRDPRGSWVIQGLSYLQGIAPQADCVANRDRAGAGRVTTATCGVDTVGSSRCLADGSAAKAAACRLGQVTLGDRSAPASPGPRPSLNRCSAPKESAWRRLGCPSTNRAEKPGCGAGATNSARSSGAPPAWDGGFGHDLMASWSDPWPVLE